LLLLLVLVLQVLLLHQLQASWCLPTKVMLLLLLQCVAWSAITVQLDVGWHAHFSKCLNLSRVSHTETDWLLLLLLLLLRWRRRRSRH
jgi:MYXO-CTERM domain-containing protein